MKKIMLATMLLLPISMSAQMTPMCNKQVFLVNGINDQNYQRCQRALSSCHGIGDMRDSKCVDSKVKLNPSCNQLVALAKKLDTTVNTLTIKPLPPFSIVEQRYFGDGERDQYIVNKQGCLLQTKIDPRKMIDDLEKQYPGEEWMLSDNGDARLEVNANDTQTVAVPLIAKKGCRACDAVATFEIDVTFDMKGRYQHTLLGNFDDAKKIPGEEEQPTDNNEAPAANPNGESESGD